MTSRAQPRRGEAPQVDPTLSTLPFLSLSLILIVFFIYLNAISIPNLEKESKALSSLEEAFPKVQETVAVSSIPLVPDTLEKAFLVIPEVTTLTPAENGETSQKEQSPEASRAEDIISKAADSHSLAMTKNEDGFVLTIPGELLFPVGDDLLSSGARTLIEELVENLKTIPYSVEIEGHTDSVPITSYRFSSNWELSVARATQVLRVFAEKGFPYERLSASGRAEFSPRAGNDSDEGRRQNRRVELVLRPLKKR